MLLVDLAAATETHMPEAEAIAVVRSVLDMKLPDFPSARFRNVHLVMKPERPDLYPNACGLVNARGSAGGYTGWRRFAVVYGSLFLEGDPLGDRAVQRWCDEGGSERQSEDVTTAISPSLTS